MTRALYEYETLPFVIRIWVDEVAESGRITTWRGQITHVPSGKQAAIKEIDDISAFVASYLAEAGIQMGFVWRMRRRLWRWLKPATGK